MWKVQKYWKNRSKPGGNRSRRCSPQCPANQSHLLPLMCTMYNYMYTMCTIYTMYTMCTMYNVQLNFRVPMSFSPSPNVQTTFSHRICSSHCDIFTSPALHWNIKHPHLFGHWQDTLPENEIELSDFCGEWPTDINSHILHTVWSDFNPKLTELQRHMV